MEQLPPVRAFRMDSKESKLNKIQHFRAFKQDLNDNTFEQLPIYSVSKICHL